MVKRQQTKSELLDLRTFYYPLNEMVWACMLATSAMIVLVKILCHGFRINLLEIIWETVAANFGGHFTHQDNFKKAYKIVTFVTLFSGNFIWMAYQASLTVDLSSPSTKLPFNNLETFLDSGWNLHTLKKG